MALICNEPFNYSTGALTGNNGGTGWNGAWVEQNGITTGYEIFASSLAYTSTGILVTSANKAGGGYQYQSSGRGLDVSGAFSTYATGGYIGLSGTTLYLSILIRAHNADIVHCNLHASGSVWDNSLPKLGLGSYDGAHWQLNVLGTTYNWSGTMSLDTDYFMVLRMDFAATNTIKLWVNPALTGIEPSADITQTTGTSVAFNSFTWHGGNSAGSGFLDEIRFGASWADVTPTTATVNKGVLATA